MNYRIPPHMMAAMQRYVQEGVQPGSFLSAIISNDLKEACARADDINKDLIWEYAHWFYNHAPSSCWGSPENMENWICMKQNEG